MASNLPFNTRVSVAQRATVNTVKYSVKYTQENNATKLDEKSLKEVHELLNHASLGKFAQVWESLDAIPDFINCIPGDIAWGILHEAAYRGRKVNVVKVLSYPECDPLILTRQDESNKFGPGRTADELTINKEIKNIIIEAQQKFLLKIVISKYLKENGNFLINDEDAIDSIAKYVETNDWENVYGTLKCNSHLINVLLPDTRLTVLHQVAIDDNLDKVIQMLDYPASNPYVETVESESHRYGSGKTPGDLAADNPKILDVINEKKDLIKRYYLSLPYFNAPDKAEVIFLIFFSSVLEDYQNILCPKGMLATNQDFQSILKQVFLYINNGANWVLAKREVAYQIRNFDVSYSNILDITAKNKVSSPEEEKRNFYSKLIQIYTREDRKLIYYKLNNLFHEQFLLQGKDKISNTNLDLGIYALILNAVLTHWDELESYHGYTYRGIILEQNVQAELVDGYEFSFLNFLSCSVMEGSLKFSKANCMLKIDNSTVCPWSPKLIGKHAATPEQGEYLYPCGARFKVVPSDSLNYINLKLIAPQ